MSRSIFLHLKNGCTKSNLHKMKITKKLLFFFTNRLLELSRTKIETKSFNNFPNYEKAIKRIVEGVYKSIIKVKDRNTFKFYRFQD